MSERDDVYLQILQFGLVQLRDAAEIGKVEYCAVEANHLHKLPSLIGESNEHRHDYYFDNERSWYLERVHRSIPGLVFTLRRYEELWRQLKELRPRA